MAISFVINIYENTIWINNNKNIELFDKDFVYISLKACQSIYQSKKYHLILEMAILDLKSCFLFDLFINSHQIVSISKVKLGKLSSPVQFI